MSECESESCEPKVKTPLLPHQQRVVDEKIELEAKMLKLMIFLDSDSDISNEDRDLLSIQLNAMKTYNSILGVRISRF